MSGPKFPPTCSECGKELARAESRIGVAFDPCPDHPMVRPVYRLQAPQFNYPAGWPLCPGCGLPALDGHTTCGDLRCNEGRYR
jgi:hypothetical protein